MKLLKTLYISVALFLVYSSESFAEHDFKSEGCEYVVTFPVKPQYKYVRAELGDNVIAQTTPEHGLPNLRAECIIVNDPSYFTREVLLESLENQAQSVGLSDIQLTVEQTKLGTLGTFTSKKQGPKAPFVMVGKWYLGQRSMLNIMIIERLDAYPSDRTMAFLRSVTR